jgi:hypothetical protein
LRRNSVLFIGYAEAALGLGEVFRNMLTALDSAGMPFAIYPLARMLKLAALALSWRADTTVTVCTT